MDLKYLSVSFFLVSISIIIGDDISSYKIFFSYFIPDFLANFSCPPPANINISAFSFGKINLSLIYVFTVSKLVVANSFAKSGNCSMTSITPTFVFVLSIIFLSNIEISVEPPPPINTHTLPFTNLVVPKTVSSFSFSCEIILKSYPVSFLNLSKKYSFSDSFKLLNILVPHT